MENRYRVETIVWCLFSTWIGKQTPDKNRGSLQVAYLSLHIYVQHSGWCLLFYTWKTYLVSIFYIYWGINHVVSSTCSWHPHNAAEENSGWCLFFYMRKIYLVSIFYIYWNSIHVVYSVRSRYPRNAAGEHVLTVTDGSLLQEDSFVHIDWRDPIYIHRVSFQ